MTAYYRIIRKHFHSDKFPDLVIATNLSLEEAQDHCSHPESSSRTCQSEKMLDYTETHGQWFDAYYEE